VTCVLLAGTVLLGRVPAGAQGSSLSRPPNTPEAYALLALEKMHVSGPISLLTGSLGVNDNDGDLEVDGSVPLQLNTQDGVIASKKASLLSPPCVPQPRSSPTPSPETRQSSAEPRRERISPKGSLRWSRTSSRPPSATYRRSVSTFPECDESARVTVDAGTELSLPSGVYGELTIDGGTLRLEGGNYVFCSVTTNNGSKVLAAAPSVLLVVDFFDVLPNSQINVGGAPQDLRVLVNGKRDAVNIAGDPPIALVLPAQPAASRAAPLATTTCAFRRPPIRSFGADTTVVVAQLNSSTG